MVILCVATRVKHIALPLRQMDKRPNEERCKGGGQQGDMA